MSVAPLEQFVRSKMRMSHIYQPTMLQVLVRNGGQATRRQIASEFLKHDESQLEYYEHITAKMPGRVLKSHGIIELTEDGYALTGVHRKLREGDRRTILQLCRDKIAEFKAERGRGLWEHRAVGLGRIPGRLRYDTLKRAGFRCELCGISADERALDVDHILPRKHGGQDVAENFQALCWKCNADKGAGDDADFRQMRQALDDREAGCPFCDVRQRDVVAENSVAVAIRDRHPVTNLHTLVIPRRHVADYFDLFSSEETAIRRLVRQIRDEIQAADSQVAGLNVGANSGAAGGQTVFHCHVHVIPRRAGDVENPRGGIRHVVPGKGDY